MEIQQNATKKIRNTVGIETALSNQTPKKSSRGLTMDTDQTFTACNPILEKK
jgi:hypothetical protein